MNIIELVKTILINYPKLYEFINDIHMEFTEGNSNNYGLSSTGDILLKEDIMGNQTRQHNFVLYARNQAYTDYDRLANSTFLLELSYWLENIVDNPSTSTVIDGIYPYGDLFPDDCAYPTEEGFSGKLLKLSSANAMLFEIPTGDINDGVTYQIQIYAQYKIELEEL